MSAEGASIRNGHKAAIREENENAILEAAEQVFAEYGFSGATTSRIADRAGIPKANLHYYFPTKEDLYRRVIDNIFNIWLDAANSLDESDDPGHFSYDHCEMLRDYKCYSVNDNDE